MLASAPAPRAAKLRRALRRLRSVVHTCLHCSTLGTMEQGHVHNCLLVLADMGGMVNEDEGSRVEGPDADGRTGAGARPGAESGAGHESRNFTFSQREPFVFGTFIHPSEVPDMRGESGGAQAGTGGPPPGMPPSLFNMGQFFRMAGPPTGADDSANASNRRSTATASSMVRLGAVPPTAHAWRLLRVPLLWWKGVPP